MSVGERDRLAARLAAARGDEPAGLVLKGGKMVNLFTGAIEETSVAVEDGVVVGVGDYAGRETVDLKGAYLAPGFIEGHLHVESTMLTPARLAEVIAPRGTAAVVADPHEIANVLGLAGIRAMLKNSQGLATDFYFMAPSCVPATPLETSGAALGAREISEALGWRRILGLAEVMNFPGAAGGDPELLDKILAAGSRPVDGHSPLMGGKQLNAYLTAGPSSDHECTRLEEAREKLARGMWVMLRQGTAAQNLADLLPVVDRFSARRCLMVSDDRHPDELANEGHMDALLRMAVSLGMDPVTALSMVSLNPARRFGLRRRGAVAPGWAADLVVLEDLEQFRVREVYHQGRLVAKDGALTEHVSPPFPPAGRDTMHLPELGEDLFRVKAAGRKARIIQLVAGQILTTQSIEPAPQKDGWLTADAKRGLARLAVVERHTASGRVGHGLVRGLEFSQGAIASSVAHDSHNLVVAGMDSLSMAAAARRVGEMGGGLCVASGGEVLGELPLAVAGLMSEAGLEEVRAELAGLRQAAGRVCRHPEPFMALSFLSLPVIPALKLTDVGLVDGNSFELVDLFLD